jgi:hypothetical protein
VKKYLIFLSGIRRAWVEIVCAQAKSQVRGSGSRKGVFRVGSVRVWHGVVLGGETRNVLCGYKADHGDGPYMLLEGTVSLCRNIFDCERNSDH